jgi:hypothetical protein
VFYGTTLSSESSSISPLLFALVHHHLSLLSNILSVYHSIQLCHRSSNASLFSGLSSNLLVITTSQRSLPLARRPPSFLSLSTARSLIPLARSLIPTSRSPLLRHQFANVLLQLRLQERDRHGWSAQPRCHLLPELAAPITLLHQCFPQGMYTLTSV